MTELSSRRFLGLDVGEVRIGVAVSDLGGTLATPLSIIDRSSGGAMQAVFQAASKAGAQAVIVGNPLHTDGTSGPQALKVQRFARRLRRAVGDLPVVLWDERFSTQDATGRLREVRGTLEPGERVDAHAAAIILQSFLDSGTPVAPVIRRPPRRRRRPPQ